MRNTEEYPVTKEEIINCLHSLASQISEEGAIGDMRPLLLQEAIAIISAAHTPQQRQAVCVLSSLVNTIADEGLVSPALLVIGDVVRVAPMWAAQEDALQERLAVRL